MIELNATLNDEGFSSATILVPKSLKCLDQLS